MTRTFDDEEDPYAVVEDDRFVKVSKDDTSDNFMELPMEKNGTLLMSTVTAQFSKATGLKYRSASGHWRGIKAEDNVLHPPDGGWGVYIYVITGSGVKRKSSASDETEGKTKKRDTERELRQDLIVKNLPSEATSSDLEEYFSKACGEMLLCEVKENSATKASRGYGFIRFKDADAAKLAIEGTHLILGQKAVVQRSIKKENMLKLFIGRLPEGTTEAELRQHFEVYGELIDVFVPRNFRGFGFVTYADDEVGYNVLRSSHDFKGVQLNVTKASPKERFDDRSRTQDDKYSKGHSNSKGSSGGKEQIVDLLATLISKR